MQVFNFANFISCEKTESLAKLSGFPVHCTYFSMNIKIWDIWKQRKAHINLFNVIFNHISIVFLKFTFSLSFILILTSDDNGNQISIVFLKLTFSQSFILILTSDDENWVNFIMKL